MNYQLRYKKEAEDSDFGWEHQSLPIGNGYLGANIFGKVQRERIQITENSLENDYTLGGLNNFAELYLTFSHEAVTQYERGLTLNNGIAYCRYVCNGVSYQREYFASYPDKVMVIHLHADRKNALSFKLHVEIPFVKDYAREPGDGGGKSGCTIVDNDLITISGKMNFYQILFEGQAKVIAKGGRTYSEQDQIIVENADEAIILFVAATNYVLKPSVFMEDDPKKKLAQIPPHAKATARMEAACTKSYEELRLSHETDFTNLFSRVDLQLTDRIPEEPTDTLKGNYQAGQTIPYLEMLFFQYGRYLLISSSRKGTLPANLQGVWNCHDQSPWGSGYWHNINVQMNYWPAFVTNLAETFEAYADFNNAFQPKAEEIASAYIKQYNPENYTDEPGECGWTIGTPSYPYTISAPGAHSGPGTGGLTTKLFWDYYAFTMDKTILKEVSYPRLLSMSKFLTKTVTDYDGRYLTSFSASPEQMWNRNFVRKGQYVQTVGCAFDQQMIYENGTDFMKAAEMLGKLDSNYQKQKEQIDQYSPVQIGWSGQIKEYEEENLYGEIGEYNHRHISQLVALYPGTLITSETPAWLDAAASTLQERGDESTGWALAHRINAWARIGDGNHAYTLVRNLLGHRTMDNLWDFHPPFQIDGNFGATAGIAEMLLQSHEGYIHILPALPDAWHTGSFHGLKARGNFDLSVHWAHGLANAISVFAHNGGICKIKYNHISTGRVYDEAHACVAVTTNGCDEIVFATEAGKIYSITDFTPIPQTAKPQGFQVNREKLLLTWKQETNCSYNIYRACDNDSTYRLLAENQQIDSYWDRGLDFSGCQQVTYKITATETGKTESKGQCQTINHATKLYLERYNRWIHQA